MDRLHTIAPLSLVALALISGPSDAALSTPRQSGKHAASAPSATVYATQVAPGSFEIWQTTAKLAQAERVHGPLAFLPIRSVGYPLKDRVRFDRPATRSDSLRAPNIRLTGEGALYRVSSAGTTSLLLARANEAPRLLLSVLDSQAGPSLAEEIHVSIDSRFAGVTTHWHAGGDVYLVDLVGSQAPRLLTAQMPPLVIAPESIRVSSTAAWFVASDRLYRDRLDDTAPPSVVALESAVGTEIVRPELALARGADTVLAVVERSNTERRVFAVPAIGPILSVTEGFADYALPNYEHPLGPFLALSPRAEFAAVRELTKKQLELHVKDLATSLPLENITVEPEFPGYVDNIGVFAFGQDEVFCFFGGDTALSTAVIDDEIGAADMYAIDLSIGTSGAVTNITRTNGLLEPPFDSVSSMQFQEAIVDPGGTRIHVIRETDSGLGLASFDVDGESGLEPNLLTALSGLAEQPQLVGTPHGMVLLAQEQIVVSGAVVSCSGDPQLAPVVRLHASDKFDILNPNATVWFDGPIALGSTLSFDATSVGATSLDKDLYLRLFDLSGALIQTVRADLKHGALLSSGDRIGALRIVEFEGVSASALKSSKSSPTRLTLEYDGASCAPMLLRPRVVLFGNDSLGIVDLIPAPAMVGFVEGTRLERLTADASGSAAAFVALRPDGVEEIYLIDLHARSFQKAFEGRGISRELVFQADGSLVFGLSDGEVHELVELSAPFEAARRSVAGSSFALAR